MSTLTDLAAEVLGLLTERGETLATAESLTGGQVAAAVTSVPGASAAYVGGVVSYATEVKIGVLGVPGDLVDRHGVISAECALAMAAGVARLTGASYGVSTTGVAGPDRQEGHPPGTVHVAAHGPDGATSVHLELTGDRSAVQDQTCHAVLSVLRGILTGEEGALR